MSKSTCGVLKRVRFGLLQMSLNTHLTLFYLTGKSCGPNGEGIEIMVGFDYTISDFAPLFVACFDNVKKANIYTKYVIPRETAARDSGNERPPWK